MTLERISIHVPGHGHGEAPVPAASRVGPFIATGGVRGVDLASGKLVEGVEAQARQMFANLRVIVEQAGGSVDTILKVTVWAGTPEARSAINAPWLLLFPDPQSRPARHVINQALPGGMLVQCDALAVMVTASPGVQ
jgi:2-iminobutanoate/2-iminopropanoate deaminase